MQMPTKVKNTDYTSFREYEENKNLVKAMQMTKEMHKNDAVCDMETLRDEMAYLAVRQHMNQISQTLNQSRKNEYFKPYGFGRGDSIY